MQYAGLEAIPTVFWTNLYDITKNITYLFDGHNISLVITNMSPNF